MKNPEHTGVQQSMLPVCVEVYEKEENNSKCNVYQNSISQEGILKITCKCSQLACHCSLNRPSSHQSYNKVASSSFVDLFQILSRFGRYLNSFSEDLAELMNKKENGIKIAFKLMLHSFKHISYHYAGFFEIIPRLNPPIIIVQSMTNPS